MIATFAYIALSLAGPIAALALVNVHLSRQPRRDFARDFANSRRLTAREQQARFGDVPHLPIGIAVVSPEHGKGISA